MRQAIHAAPRRSEVLLANVPEPGAIRDRCRDRQTSQHDREKKAAKAIRWYVVSRMAGIVMRDFPWLITIMAVVLFVLLPIAMGLFRYG